MSLKLGSNPELKRRHARLDNGSYTRELSEPWDAPLRSEQRLHIHVQHEAIAREDVFIE